MSSKPLKAVLKSVGKNRKAHSLSELIPRRIRFVPAEKHDVLNPNLTMMGIVPLNGPNSAKSASHKSFERERNSDSSDDTDNDDEKEDDDEEEEDPLDFENERMKELLSWETGVTEKERKELRNVGAGLFNVGNTCFLDATLQCLTHTVPFSTFMLSGDIQDHHKSCLFF